jgi:hypothetical protein
VAGGIVELSERPGWMIAAEWAVTAVIFGWLALANMTRWTARR